MIQGKVWGSTQCIIKTNNFEVHRISIKKGYECSKHKHNHKINGFFIERGVLEIHTWKNDYDLVDITKLSRGDFTEVCPNEWHKFVSITDVVAYEIYWLPSIDSDIIRDTVGGKVH